MINFLLKTIVRNHQESLQVSVTSYRRYMLRTLKLTHGRLKDNCIFIRLCKLYLSIDLRVNMMKHTQNLWKKSQIPLWPLKIPSISWAYAHHNLHKEFHVSAGLHLVFSKNKFSHYFWLQAWNFLSAPIIYFIFQRWNCSCTEKNG